MGRKSAGLRRFLLVAHATLKTISLRCHLALVSNVGNDDGAHGDDRSDDVHEAGDVRGVMPSGSQEGKKSPEEGDDVG